MSVTGTELRTILTRDHNPSTTSTRHELIEERDQQPPPTPVYPANVSTAVPEGGYGWTVVTSCATLTFWFNGIPASWGVIQAHLLTSSLSRVPTSTVSFVGTLSLAMIVFFSLLILPVIRAVGVRAAGLLGISLIALAELTASFTTDNVGGLFGTAGAIFGLGACLLYSLANTLPTQYFSARLGLASGLVKLGGGIGATVISIVAETLIARVGMQWMFRTVSLLIILTGLPAAWVLRERFTGASPRAPLLDLSLFRNGPFTTVFCPGAVGVFAMFVPPFFLPLVAQSVGLSSKTGASLVAGFNGCTAIGRLLAGWASDRIGPLNTFGLMVLLNAVSMLAIWPVSTSLAPLVVFSILNGLSNGAFFSVFPIVVASTAERIEGNSGVAVAMALGVFGWTPGYLMGVPIAGYLLQASGIGVGDRGDSSGSGSGSGDGSAPPNAAFGVSIDPYRPAIFYAGGVALVSAVLVLLARLMVTRGVKKRV